MIQLASAVPISEEWQDVDGLHTPRGSCHYEAVEACNGQVHSTFPVRIYNGMS